MRVSVIATSALCFLVLAGSHGQAQVPATSSSQLAPLPSLGFIPPYEIARTVRRSGFDPLAPPLREGSTYVVRATDFRGILMRVVVDARSGAIRDVNRIVPGPGSYGQQAEMMPYGSDPDDLPLPYGQPAGYDLPSAPLENGEVLAPSRPSAAHPLTRASVTILPPLPRPRPPELASRKSIEDAKPSAAKAAAVSESKTDKPEAKEKPEVTGSAPSAAPEPSAAPVAAPATPPTPPGPPAPVAAKPGKSLQPPPIND